MSMNSRKLKVGAFAVLVAIAVAGCGGGGEKGDAASQTGSNSPPAIQGQPSSTVLAGQQYSFQPSASDANGDTLTFSVTNLPSWATFSTSTGRISGTPSSLDVGTYSGVTVRVSDGSAAASLSMFAITVTDAATGSATLSWTPPTQNSDGSALTDLAGYQIQYGRSANDLAQAVSLTDPSLSTYVLENLTSGIWYFAITAVNASGVSSALSNVASKTIS